ncbi:MAG: hypothetical protein ACUVXI_04080 [bacterium]
MTKAEKMEVMEELPDLFEAAKASLEGAIAALNAGNLTEAHDKAVGAFAVANTIVEIISKG